MIIPVLAPENDFALGVRLRTLNEQGREVPLTEGAVAFLAASDAPDAPSIVAASVTHVGAGRWLVAFDATELPAELLATHFAAATPYVIVRVPGSIRVAVECQYQQARHATVEP